MPDRFPQPSKYEFTMPNAGSDLGQEIRFPLVLPRRETESTRIVTEIISVKYDMGSAAHVLFQDAKATPGALFGYRSSLSYRPLTALENSHILPTATLGDIAVLDAVHIAFVSIDDGTPANNETAALGGIFVSEMTGGVGRGLIIPGDRLFFNQTTNSNLSPHTVGLVIYYRQHLVGLSEYLGILAGFQQNPS